MTFKELNLGDVFKVTDHSGMVVRPDRLWRKESPTRARVVGQVPGTQSLSAGELRDAVIEVVEHGDTSPIRRQDDMLILKGGDVVLTHQKPFRVYRCVPGEQFTEFILPDTSFYRSEAKVIGPDTALLFSITKGPQALGRKSSNSEVFAYGGRVYARATGQEVTGKKRVGGYKRLVTLDGAKRMVIAGLLTIPDDCALFDIIQEQFGAMAPGESPTPGSP
jgi:hypothetical protein